MAAGSLAAGSGCDGGSLRPDGDDGAPAGARGGGLPKIDPKKSVSGFDCPDWARAGSMAGGAASSTAPTNKARDVMLRAIKFRLFAFNSLSN